jgi:hypothetical protein
MEYNDILSVMMLERIKELNGIDLEHWTKAQYIYFD